jgi:hypothetical protein
MLNSIAVGYKNNHRLLSGGVIRHLKNARPVAASAKNAEKSPLWAVDSWNEDRK